MTTIKFLKNENGINVGILFEGHARHNPGGPDIVCSALSAVSDIALRFYSIALTKPLGQLTTVIDEDAARIVIIDKKASESEAIQILLNSIYSMIKDLAELYPESVKLCEGDESNETL